MQEVNGDAAGEASGNEEQSSVTTDPQSLCKQGIKEYTDGDYKSAIATLELALAERREEWKAFACLGLAYYQEGNLSRAEETFDYLISNCPQEEIKARSTQALARVKQAQANRETQQAAAGSDAVSAAAPAEASTETAAESGTPTAEGALSETAEGQPAAEVDPPVAPEVTEADKTKYCKWGTNCYLDEKYEKAIEYLELGLSGDSENWNARFCLGLSYSKVGQYELAQIVLSNLIEQCPDSKIASRAKQALDNVKLAMTAPPEGSEIVVPVAAPAPAATKKLKAAAPQVTFTAAKEEKAEIERPTNTLMMVVLVVLLLGIGYYSLSLALPNIYNGTILPGNAGIPSVSSIGDLAGVKATTLDVPGPHRTRLVAVAYEKPEAHKIVLIHSSSTNDLAMRKSLAEALLQAGFSVVLYDAHGTGRSIGDATWQGIADDGLFVCDHMLGPLGYRAESIQNYGCGLGTASAVLTATARPGGALVIEDPFLSIPQVARDRNPLLAIFPDSLCPQPQINLASMLSPHPPLLVVLSQNAPIAASDSQQLVAKISEPKEVSNVSAGANSPHWDSIVKFFEK